VDRKFYINANNLEIIKINLYDLTGKEINITSRFNSTDNTIELSGIHKGIYILNIELINDTNHSIKVIKD
ncbi:T9SS type A sorting domain-containing protein, partial [Nonlabens ulvanivorans]